MRLAAAASDAAKGEGNGQVPATRQQGSAQTEGDQAASRDAGLALCRKGRVDPKQPAETKGLKRKQRRMRIRPTFRLPFALSAPGGPNRKFVVNLDERAAGFQAGSFGASDASPRKRVQSCNISVECPAAAC
jgi:hypothetical protein